tara:strand:+ start:642 stop:980 length:339 start_codon:yes stop_codon:yes gene_type:complete
MTQTIGSNGAPAVTAEEELTHKTPAGTKPGTPTKAQEKAKKVEAEEAPLTTDEKLTQLSHRMDECVKVVNNVIAFCNTLEKWRTLPFKTEEQMKAEQEATTKTEESNQTTSE